MMPSIAMCARWYVLRKKTPADAEGEGSCGVAATGSAAGIRWQCSVRVAPSGSAKRSLRPSALVRCQGLAVGPRDGPAHQPLDPQRAQLATSAMDRVAQRRPAVVLAVRLTA